MLNTECAASVKVVGDGVPRFSRGGSSPIPLIVKSKSGSISKLSWSVLSLDGEGLKHIGVVNPDGSIVDGTELSNAMPCASAISLMLWSISSFVSTVIQLNSSFIPPENGAISSSKNMSSSSLSLSTFILTPLNFFFACGLMSCLRLSDDLLFDTFLHGFEELFLDGFWVLTPLLRLKTPSTNMSAYAGSIFQNPPFPGSFLFLATFTKHLFSERLWRIEFWGKKKTITLSCVHNPKRSKTWTSLTWLNFRFSFQYTLFQNGRYLDILLFLFKLDFDASFKAKYSFEFSAQDSRHQGLIWIKTTEYLNDGHVYSSFINYNLFYENQGSKLVAQTSCKNSLSTRTCHLMARASDRCTEVAVNPG